MTKTTKSSKKNQKKTIEKPVPTTSKIFQKFLPLSFLVFSIILFLSLRSFNPTDLDVLRGGKSNETWLPSNDIGIVGTYLSHYFFKSIGGISYILAFFLGISGLKQLFFQSKKFNWEYFIGIFLATFGLAMMAGIYPGTLPNPIDSELSGGVIGNRFCHPHAPIGWIYHFANKTGSLIISGATFLMGFLIIWVHDWHDSFVKLCKDLYQYSTADKPQKEKKAKPLKEEKKLKPTNKRNQAETIFSKLNSSLQTRKPIPKQPVFDTFQSPEPTPMEPPSLQMPTPVKRKKKATKQQFKGDGTYSLPNYSLLSNEPSHNNGVNSAEIEKKKKILQHTLESFKVNATVSNVTSGPRVTLFEIVTAPGVNLNKITNISANIAMELKAQSLRILAPIPGKNSVGIEVPNEKASPVFIRPLLESPEWQSDNLLIPLTLGRDISGSPICLDLAKAPHLLIAGATGSGKSVCMNTIIASILYRFTPDELNLILVDPKVVEFKNYETLPHLVTPVVNEPQKVTMALHWAVKEMEHRYKVLAQCGVKNIEAFNNRPPSTHLELDERNEPIPQKMPFLVIIIDELADIMMTAKGDVETCLARIAQLGRASGIHAIVATQRPSVNVITGVIKANFPTRIAFKVTSTVDSRTILDKKGADQLLGQGDMLFNPPGASNLIRIQGAYVPEDELENVVECVSNQVEQKFNESIIISPDDPVASGGTMGTPLGDMAPSPGFEDTDISNADEELIQRAIGVIQKDGKASISYIQRSLRIGYNRAATIVDTLEERGIVGPQIGASAREILIPTNKE
jgi:S-DNA-T family DNA segregation ATPase FtsK/SpoIIIE